MVAMDYRFGDNPVAVGTPEYDERHGTHTAPANWEELHASAVDEFARIPALRSIAAHLVTVHGAGVQRYINSRAGKGEALNAYAAMRGTKDWQPISRGPVFMDALERVALEFLPYL